MGPAKAVPRAASEDTDEMEDRAELSRCIVPCCRVLAVGSKWISSQMMDGSGETIQKEVAVASLSLCFFLV